MSESEEERAHAELREVKSHLNNYRWQRRRGPTCSHPEHRS